MVLGKVTRDTWHLRPRGGLPMNLFTLDNLFLLLMSPALAWGFIKDIQR